MNNMSLTACLYSILHIILIGDIAIGNYYSKLCPQNGVILFIISASVMYTAVQFL